MANLSTHEVNKIMKALKKRRKIVWVKETEIMSLFIAAAVATGKLTPEARQMNLVLPGIKELPEGALFDGCFFDPINGAFGLVVLHDLFPVVNPGESPEFLTGTLETKHVHCIVHGSQVIGSDLN